MSNVSISIPHEYSALMHASDMLRNIADDMTSGDGSGATPQSVVGVTQNGTIVGTTTIPASVTVGSTPPPTIEDVDDDDDRPSDPFTKVDGTGLPWDARIHASTKTQTSKHKWKRKKGVDDATFAAVEAELRGTMSAPVSTTPTETAPPAPVAPPTLSDSDEFMLEGASYTVAQLRQSRWTDDEIMKLERANVMTFPEFMGKLTAAMTSGDVTQDQINAALQTHGIASTPLLATRADLIPAVNAELFG